MDFTPAFKRVFLDEVMLKKISKVVETGDPASTIEEMVRRGILPENAEIWLVIDDVIDVSPLSSERMVCMVCDQHFMNGEAKGAVGVICSLCLNAGEPT